MKVVLMVLVLSVSALGNFKSDFNIAGPALRATVVTAQLHIIRKDSTPRQKALIDKMLPMVPYMEGGVRFDDEIREVFGNDRRFYDPHPTVRDYLRVAVGAIGDLAEIECLSGKCECSGVSGGDCAQDYRCVSQMTGRTCTVTYFGCGAAWWYTCDGICYFWPGGDTLQSKN